MFVYLESFSTFLPPPGQKALIKCTKPKILSVPVFFRGGPMESVYEMVWFILFITLALSPKWYNWEIPSVHIICCLLNYFTQIGFG